MPLDRARIGYALAPFRVDVEQESLTRFCDAIGERSARFREREAPPTYMKVLEGQDNSSRRIMEALGADLRGILHAEQQFEYLAPITVGSSVTVERVVADIIDKKGGALQFVVIDTRFTSGAGDLLGRSRQTVMVREPKGAR